MRDREMCLDLVIQLRVYLGGPRCRYTRQHLRLDLSPTGAVWFIPVVLMYIDGCCPNLILLCVFISLLVSA